MDDNKAFTLIELLVVVSIIVLMTALTLPNYRSGDSQLALQRSAHKMAQSLRMAQEYAISVKDFNGGVPGGYGIYFDLDQPDRYIMFADLDGDRIYSMPDEKAEEIIIEGEVVLDALTPVDQENSLNIFFAPPDPAIYFFPDAVLAIIDIKVQDSQKSIQVNKAGLIAVAEGLGDQCNSDADCSDGNLCTNDWCERPADLNSVCHNDSRPNGIDCGDCRECQSGSCTYLCQRTESSCECINDYCRDCSDYYGINCDYGTCALIQKPSWSCSAGACQYSCNNDPACVIACSNDSECDDGSPCTSDSCINAGTLASSCIHSPVAGENGLAACKTCDGNSSTPVNITTFFDSEGLNICAGTCVAYCSSGSCINTDTGVGTCTVATNARVVSGGNGQCFSGACCAGGTYSPSSSWTKVADTTVRDISNLSNTAIINKDIYCDNFNCILWTDGAAAPTIICIATDSNVYGNILWSKTDKSTTYYQYGELGSSLSGDRIGGTHPLGLLVGYRGSDIGEQNWLSRDYTSGIFPAMAACKTKGAGWRLPTALEFDSIRDQETGAKPYTRLPGMTTRRYWTASERDANTAYSMSFYYGYSDYNYKNTAYLVRCVQR